MLAAELLKHFEQLRANAMAIIPEALTAAVPYAQGLLVSYLGDQAANYDVQIIGNGIQIIDTNQDLQVDVNGDPIEPATFEIEAVMQDTNTFIQQYVDTGLIPNG